MKNKQTKSGCAGLFLGMMVLLAPLVQAQTEKGQASLVLDGNIEMRNTQSYQWRLEKTGREKSLTAVSWTISAVKEPVGVQGKTVNIFGVLSVTNAGSASARIGNVVLNLQKQNSQGSGWVSVAANIANSTQAEAATAAKVALASTENQSLNQSQGPANYTVNGLSATFTETQGTGGLVLTDPQQKTLVQLAQQGGILPGQTLALFFNARFDNALLSLPAGTPLRLEVLVTFANAGMRGNGGASTTNLDIDGNGVVSAEEATVRTVACRMSRSLPALIDINQTATLTDAINNISTTGMMQFSNYTSTIGGGTGVATISNSTSETVAVTMTGFSGTIQNCATLRSSNPQVSVGSATPVFDPVTGLTKSMTFNFSYGGTTNLSACASYTVMRGSIF